MNKGMIIVTILIVGAAGFFLGARQTPEMPAAGTDRAAEREILYWVAPMDPNYRRDEPGKSPMGMDLIPVYANAGEADASVVRISPAVENNLGVRTATVKLGALPRVIDTVGYVQYDENELHHIHTRVEGWVETLSTKSSGERVSPGQTLFEVYSPTLVTAQQEYLAALASGSAALQTASRDRLLAFGLTAAQIEQLTRTKRARQRIETYADIEGIVASLDIREGMFVTPSTTIMSLATLKSVWVLAEVFERHSAWVEVGQPVEVTLDYIPGHIWIGAVDYIYPELDPKTRTLKVRIKFDNPEEVLLPNMFARVTIAGTLTEPVPYIPREALIRGGRQDRVVIALGDGRFRSTPVATGMESGTWIEILEGLEPGQQIVTSAQFLLDSESSLDAGFARMENTATGGVLP